MALAQQHSHPFNITNPNFNYIPANKTDVTQTWRKAGWVPPSKIKGYFDKKRKQLMEDMAYEESNAATQYDQQPF
jgi:hypothetical protein